MSSVGRFLGGFSRGALSFLDGWALLARNRRWWRYAAWPVFIQLVFSVFFLLLVNYYAAEFIRSLFQNMSTEWVRDSLRLLLRILAFVASCLLSGVLWVAVAGVVCPFFYEKLTRSVEISMGTPESQLKGLSVLDEMREAIWIFVQLAFVQGALLALAFFPIVGAPLAFVLGWYFTAWKLGSELFDYPLSIRGKKRSERLLLRRQFKPEVLGIGTIIIAIASIPVLGSILLVPCLIGAVTLHHRLLIRK